jgi:A/G-specific adenine glycosylase
LRTFFKIAAGLVEETAKILAKWYEGHKRDLPWRRAESAYEIWLSEIILQQTRVQQGIHYYERFLERFPDVHQLAKASPEEVLKLWQGLGYYTRARNLHATAREIVSRYDGRFPADYNKLLALKGVGEYTAAAVASIAFGIPVALVDGNVLRVLARLYGISIPVTTPKGRKEIHTLADRILDKRNPGIHNQAIMELGALVCLPKNPSCRDCPLHPKCYACKHERIKDFPVRGVREKSRKRYFHYLHFSCSGKVFIHQRNKKDIWNSLFEFPVIETSRAVEPEKITANKQWRHLLEGCRYRIIEVSPLYIHHLSHQTLYVRFYEVQAATAPSVLAQEYTCIDAKRIHEYPVSRLTEKYLMSRKD